MNQEHGQLELALQLAQEGQERGNLSGVVLVDAVQADQGIEDEQAGLELLDGVGEALAIGGSVQTQGRRGDDFDGQGIEGHLGRPGDAFQALAHDRQGVLGGKEQDFSGACHGILAQTGAARGDADGDVQGQEAFAAFGFTAEDADGLVSPEALDEPLGLRTGGGQQAGALDRQGVHDFLGLGSRAKISK